MVNPKDQTTPDGAPRAAEFRRTMIYALAGGVVAAGVAGGITFVIGSRAVGLAAPSGAGSQAKVTQLVREHVKNVAHGPGWSQHRQQTIGTYLRHVTPQASTVAC
jgi:hypothetical protein